MNPQSVARFGRSGTKRPLLTPKSKLPRLPREWYRGRAVLFWTQTIEGRLGAMMPGYPEFDPRTEDFWDDFWKIYNRLVESHA